jgi:predicted glycogen debranching enzyme
MEPIEFGPEILSSMDASLEREWLETNGIGGFASSTIIGVNTRRYHGLLVAAIKPPVERLVLLSKVEETVVMNGKHHDLGSNRYPGVIYPRGFEMLTRFALDPFPKFTFRIGDIEIEKRVFLVHGENTVVIEYETRGGGSCTLAIRPLIAFRDYHSLTHRNSALNTEIVTLEGCVQITPYAGLPTLCTSHNGVAVESTGDWYYNFEYDRELERGLNFQEDLFNPFQVRYEIRSGEIARLVASTRPVDVSEVPAMREREIARRRVVVAESPSTDEFIQRLTSAADQFIVKRGGLKTIIAGYHWFSDWGRDTMISLPGLTLVTDRFDVARSILQAFAGRIDQGMLPNRFPDAGETPEYNSVDATLWFFEAVRSYLAWTGDVDFVVREMYPRLIDIIDWHRRGTRYRIKTDSDGLLSCGEPGVQLTWMDAKVGDRVVTPRYGKPVEIQALWYNALRVIEHLADQAGDIDRNVFFREMAGTARRSFNIAFWNSVENCLFDVVDGDDRDAAIRPNQIFTISLHHAILTEERWNAVLHVVTRELLTPAGIRTLSPKDPAYCAAYKGRPHDRDCAYHQGTVWPWLMGPFLSAYVKVHGASRSAREQAAEWLRGFELMMTHAGLGQLPELADADPPHTPRGCIAQAWSVAELLRAAIEDVYQLGPVAALAVSR